MLCLRERLKYEIMTRQEILSYLDGQNILLDNKNSLTRIHFAANHSQIVHFLKENQTEELMNDDRWVIYSLDNLSDGMHVEGKLMLKLTSITLPNIFVKSRE
jgi:hypothetical protein